MCSPAKRARKQWTLGSLSVSGIFIEEDQQEQEQEQDRIESAGGQSAAVAKGSFRLEF